MLTVGLTFEILFWEVEEAYGIKFVAVNRTSNTLYYLHNAITVKLQS